MNFSEIMNANEGNVRSRMAVCWKQNPMATEVYLAGNLVFAQKNDAANHATDLSRGGKNVRVMPVTKAEYAAYMAELEPKEAPEAPKVPATDLDSYPDGPAKDAVVAAEAALAAAKGAYSKLPENTGTKKRTDAANRVTECEDAAKEAWAALQASLIAE